MLRLMIVDDEKVIRETIRSFIDWNEIGIEVVGVCKDGVEAYDMILDEYPDIVLTDIQMPGLSGLELIERIMTADKSIEFVILSGYEDFEYAKTAMKYGVKHYLLKPCNEMQIIEIMESVKEDCYRKRSVNAIHRENQFLSEKIRRDTIKNLLVHCLIWREDLDSIIKVYKQFLDFENTEYELCYFYYLEEENLDQYLAQIEQFIKGKYPNVIIYTLYVKNTLTVFLKSFEISYYEFDRYFSGLQLSNGETAVEYKRETYKNLTGLLHNLLKRLERYEIIYILERNSKIPIYNHNALLHNMNELVTRLADEESDNFMEIREELNELLNSANDIELLKSSITTLLLKISSALNRSYSSIGFTDLFMAINESDDEDEIRCITMEKLSDIFSEQSSGQQKHKNYIDKVILYVEQNLQNPNLSLKWIAENVLYMNVDYLSKQFFKQTGYKFSFYLMKLRMEKAKTLLLEMGQEKIYMIAEAVGCGNSPQYFSQVFKRYTGMTPTAYIKNKGEIENDK